MWLPEVVDLSGGDQELLEPGSASRAIAWDKVRHLLHACIFLSGEHMKLCKPCHYGYADFFYVGKTDIGLHHLSTRDN